MVKYLIKLCAAALARRIERGSAAGAFVGAIAGAGIGIGAAYRLNQSNFMFGSQYAVAVYLIFPIPLAILGALGGTRFGPARKAIVAEPGIRLTRYNRAAGSLAVAMIFLAVIVGLATVKDGGKPEEQMSSAAKFAIAAGVGLAFLVAAFIAAREVWYVELGQTISVRRLLRSRFYSRHDLQIWGFEIRENEVVQTPFASGKLNCCLQFVDGVTCRVEVDASDSAAIAKVLDNKSN